MINYRMEDLEWLVGKLKKESVNILDEIKTYDYGKFVHILDPNGNKLNYGSQLTTSLIRVQKEGQSRTSVLSSKIDRLS